MRYMTDSAETSEMLHGEMWSRWRNVILWPAELHK